MERLELQQMSSLDVISSCIHYIKSKIAEKLVTELHMNAGGEDEEENGNGTAETINELGDRNRKLAFIDSELWTESHSHFIAQQFLQLNSLSSSSSSNLTTPQQPQTQPQHSSTNVHVLFASIEKVVLQQQRAALSTNNNDSSLLSSLEYEAQDDDDNDGGADEEKSSTKMEQVPHVGNMKKYELKMFIKPSLINYCISRRVVYFVKQFPLLSWNQEQQQQPSTLGTESSTSRNDSAHSDCPYLLSGLIVDSALDTLLRVMRGTFAPMLLNKERNQWPDSLQKDFVSQFHKFLASLTETAHKMKGRTVLYVPFENIQSIESAQKHKELVQRLEAALMRWTSQIKEVVQGDKDTAENIENARPLAEIQFWKSRAQDLMNIKRQIQREDVQTIVKVLSGSSYLKTFKDLSDDIQNGCDEALDNHKFLLTIKEPCERLAIATPVQIPSIIPEILHLIHKIHDLFLKDIGKTQERLTGLLREISNEIIHICCQHIHLEEIWNGNVHKCIQSLNESIYAGEFWKRICNRQEEYYKFDRSSVFGEINAFVQRCNELLEMCEAQIQFGNHFSSGAQSATTNNTSTDDQETSLEDASTTSPSSMAIKTMPIFSGTNGPEITKSLLEIQHAFSRYMHDIQQLKYPILDVKSTSWHDDFKKFKNGIRDLELIMQNVISSAFESVTDTENAVQMLEAFHTLAKRENIKAIVEVKSAEVCSVFQKQLETIQTQFELQRKSPPIPYHHPKYAGAALWTHSILSKIHSEMDIIHQAHFMPDTRELRELKMKHESVVQSLQKHIDKIFVEWQQFLSTIGFTATMIQNYLDQPLMKRSTDHPYLLQLNFENKLVVQYEEVKYWRKLPQYELPAFLQDLVNDREKMRVYRENVSTVVKSYNQIILSLSPEESKLFRQRIQTLDIEIKKGLIKQTGIKCYSWNSRAEIEVFVKSCRKMCDEVRTILNEFKLGVTNIYNRTQIMAQTLFISIESKKIYNEMEMEFEKEQASHREVAKNQLLAANNEIFSILKNLYKYFEDHDDGVQEQWWMFICTIEQKIDTSLRVAVKKSLQALSMAIRPDKSNEVGRLINNSPLFLVNVVLEKDDSDMSPALQPSVEKLIDIVDEVIRYLIRVSAVVPKLEQSMRDYIEHQRSLKLSELLEAEGTVTEQDDESDIGSEDENETSVSKKQSSNYFENNISEDKDIRQLIKIIIEGMDTISGEVEEYLARWSKDFREIWFTNKDKFLSRFGSQNRTAEGFETEIDKYKDHQFKIQNMEPTKIISYLQLDSAPLKHTLVLECNLWQTRLLDLLHSIAQKEMNKFYELFEKNEKLLRQEPTNLDELEEKIKLATKLNQEHPKNELLFQPICERYDLLKKFDVNIPEAEWEKRNNLKDAGVEFKKVIDDTLISLEYDKDKFRIKLKSSVDVFTQNVTALKSDFLSRGPYSAKNTVMQANSVLRDFKNKILIHRKEETKLRAGMKIFSLEMPQYKELRDISKDIESLERVWAIYAEWSEQSKRWNQSTFNNLDVDELQSELMKFNERINSIGKDARDWGIWQRLKEDVDKFKKLLPLVIDLKSPAIRDRHWEELSEMMGINIDLQSKSFNLKTMMDLGFDNYMEDINNMTSSATQELNIESDLEKIRETWQITRFDISEYKSIYYKLNSTEEIYLNLDDNMATLGSMKISPYVGSFQAEVNEWERNLSKISETIDMILQVQKQWLYLFNIFDVDDIQKQLPTEAGVFKTVNNRWKSAMGNIGETKNVLRACLRDGLLPSLNEMNSKLEQIQKQLDQYLEKKRKLFPRFYFLSDNDLLEILGQARDPNAIQHHLKNLFEAIRRLKIESTTETKQGTSYYVAHGMFSAENEYIEFNHPITLEGHVEVWLQSVENAMRSAIKKNLSKCFTSLKALSKDKEMSNRDSWIPSWAGQLLITSSQLYWTQRISETLSHEKEGKKGGSKEQKDIAKIPKVLQLRRDEWNQYLEGYSRMIREELPSLEREKLIALITMEVHARDATERLVKSKCTSLEDFEWLKQLRFYMDEEADKCVVRQTTAEIDYDYEYVGNSGRLVITPLTERCYMTLTTALQLKRGGNPQGPAGTGKTETVKDLGKSIAKYVIVFNCSDSMDYKSLGRLLSGIVQTGAWSCLDEFNRIELDVLSVVAQQISLILTAMAAGASTFIFEGQETIINHACGIFVTMNPGYAGRSELPDNLKALLRPVSMMKPDSSLICQIRLRAQGFKEADELSRKVATLYSLMEQQLSRQKHYDFGLRNITAVLDAAGVLKRQQPDAQEHILLLTACRNMNEPKFISDDMPLFNAIISDLFPAIEQPEREVDSLHNAIVDELRANSLQEVPYIIERCIQLYDTKKTRHGVMVVGKSSSGKTTSWKTLKNALTKLKQTNPKQSIFNTVTEYIINPKAISTDELYGNYTKGRDWKNGVFSVIMKETCNDTKPDEKWIIFDGPVDTLWIESMNTLLDDNKILTLINGTRISLSQQVSLLFEVQDLDQASPATVSRCGMIFFDEKDLGWKPIIRTWLKKRGLYEKSMNNPHSEEVIKYLSSMCDKFIQRAIESRYDQIQTVQTNDINAVQSFISLYDSLATIENGLDPKDKDQYLETVQKYFVFSLIWSIGATVDVDGRRKMDILFREVDPQLPSKATAYEYFIDTKSRTWKSWEERVNQTWKPSPNTPFYKIIVPTIDTVRNSFVINALVKAKKNVLVVGQVGTGKTIIVNSVISQLDQSDYSTFTINFSARTESSTLQNVIESRVEKKPFDILQPFGGKQLVIFLDDLNMPKKDEYGSQPPLELLRQWIEHGFWYDRQKQTKKILKKTQLVAAMGPPSGGRTVISERLQSKFNVLNITFPSDAQTKRIFGTILKTRIEGIEEIKSLSDIATQATIDIYRSVTTNLLPTPTRSHYIFNMRDLSKVFQGIVQADHESMDNKDQFIRLWLHECYRVFYDRLNNDQDRSWFASMTASKSFDAFNLKIQDGQNIIVSDISNPGSYLEVSDISELKKDIEMKLADYNDTLGNRPMKLVLFQDAVEHLCRIHRILKQPRGNALLVGVGGSGRQSLTRLAAYISGHKLFTIEVSKSYSVKQFHDDLKQLYFETGLKNRPVTFFFSDTQIMNERFLEDVNNMLGSGEVPNLFDSDDMNQILDGARKEAIASGKTDTQEEIFGFFMEQVRNNMHIVISMSPVHHEFRNRIRMFPALVNSTTIDWFSEWPSSALQEVAIYFLEQEKDFGFNAETQKFIADIFVTVHESVVNQSQRMLAERKRHNYVTPTNYLELITGFVSLMHEKRNEITGLINKLEMGLTTLENARVEVERMSVDLEKQKKHAAQSKQECENLMMIVLSEKSQADDKKQQVELDRANIEREKMNAQKLQAAAEEELKAALPDLELATKALETLEPKDISEIKQYNNPHPLVKNVLMVVMVVLKKKPDYNVAKQLMASPLKFIQMMLDYKKNEISEQLRTKIEKEIKKQGLDPEAVKGVSMAAYGMCLWVIAINNYAKVYKGVKPLEEKLKKAEEELEKSMRRLAEAEKSYKELSEKVQALTEKYDQKLEEKEMYRKQAEDTETKLNRAAQLVGGLSGERERWTNSIAVLKKDLSNIVGDNLLAASFLSYSGPFSTTYRQYLMEEVWKKTIRSYKISFSNDFTIQTYLGRPTELRSWTLQGLPSDSFSAENGILVTRGKRWPLLVDPQNQANKWVKNLEKDNRLEICYMKDSDLLRKLTNAIKFGFPVLIQDIGEEIDPSLEPILSKAVTKKGNREIMMLGDSEITVNKNFKLYLTTKLQNPHYQPEISTKTTIVNFNVTQQGLEDQLLGIVVSTERKELEEQKSEIVVKVAAGKQKMEELEDETLRLLTTTSGSALLDDENLINTLQQSKQISEEIKLQLVVSQDTETKIDIARNQYRNAARRASVLYFVLCDMSVIDPMYQFSLKSYIDLFSQSINTSKKPPKLDMIKQRVDLLNEHHTLEVYRTTCQGLFERHKLLFAFHMAIKIMEEADQLNLDEYQFFLRGAQIIGARPVNSCKWLPDKCWENIYELDKLPSFHGIANSFEEEGEEWRNWFRSMKPETEQIPSEWQSKINDWGKMLLVRSVREDRVTFMVKSFIVERMGSDKFVKPPINEISNVITGSTCSTPLMFILSPGVDPQKQLEKYAKSKNIRLITLALGKDQEAIATKCIQDARSTGDWVFLANCHLLINWMSLLDDIIESFNDDPPNPNFRLWLSSKPHQHFPITLLQRSRKITTEPPQGLQSNLERIYRSMVSEERFQELPPHIIPMYKKLFFSLSFFHSVLLERRKFGTLGWNIPYDFNDSDFAISENILDMYLRKYEKIPWEALTYLIADVSYGGRVTDDMDRRLLDVYIRQYINQLAIDADSYELSTDSSYRIPPVGNYVSYLEFIKQLRVDDPPEAFGQHPNADISSQIHQTNEMLDTLQTIAPIVSTSSSPSTSKSSSTSKTKNAQGSLTVEQKVLQTADDILRNRVPSVLDYETAKSQEESALNTVLLQEIVRYNHLLTIVKTSLVDLTKAIKGEIVMDSELESVFNALNENKVPMSWNVIYPSQKPLTSWIRDLQRRVEQFKNWASGGPPTVFWLPGFSFPSGFLTAIKQMAARSHRYAVDELTFEYIVMNPSASLHQRPKEGVYVKGMILEGAKWDSSAGNLTEPNPMELSSEMPVIHFKPVLIPQSTTNKKKVSKEIYNCPVYMFPIRCGTKEHTSFVTTIGLKSGTEPPSHWVKRGTALLLSDNQ